MNVFRNIILSFGILVFLSFISIVILYFINFNGGFSNNPEHWYAAGSLIISFLTALITIIIAIYIYELNKRSSKFSDQKQLFIEISRLVNNLHFELQTNYSNKNYIAKIEDAESKLKEYKGLAFIFNDEELVIKKIEAYRRGLEKIRNDAAEEVSKKIKVFSREIVDEYINKPMWEVSYNTFTNATTIIKPLLTDLVNSLKMAMK